ncbi:hypothetical protein HRM2_18210 [Desulforapulum autotrophicum HRM2]|uniref:Uncharacterized protein n=1 Tax=Desulforapulum autotrophicum (strain ATCC 43914 / DSM 3382 / VKM B-1955 / HRM2) TaxID=177437 RepID=C0QBR1_DESAH|nr:hypothetical protein HRM2_18210 [Desulforapulum autotrophicum HRM2]
MIFSKKSNPDLRDSETNNSSILLVFQLVFCVASKGTYFNMLPLIRLEYELKSYTIFVELFTSEPLTTVFDLPHTPGEVEVRSENGPPISHVGGVNFCRSRFKIIFIIPPTSTDFHHISAQ